MSIATFELAYSGFDADKHVINFYDVAEALLGFQRSLALTVHLVLNDEVITHAPSLKDATILALPPERGSWKFLARVSLIGTAIYALGVAPRDSVIGNLVTSAYDYVISETLGFHVDFDETLGQQYENLRESRSRVPQLTQSRLDSLAEKCEAAIKNIHRPISAGKTAERADIAAIVAEDRRSIGGPFTMQTYEHIAYTTRSEQTEILRGRVSSYNSNTYKGRVFVPAYGRPVPFELFDLARSKGNVHLVTGSLSANALQTNADAGYLYLRCYLRRSKSGVIKRLEVTEVSTELL
jgi:hypothetical protein